MKPEIGCAEGYITETEEVGGLICYGLMVVEFFYISPINYLYLTQISQISQKEKFLNREIKRVR